MQKFVLTFLFVGAASGQIVNNGPGGGVGVVRNPGPQVSQRRSDLPTDALSQRNIYDGYADYDALLSEDTNSYPREAVGSLSANNRPSRPNNNNQLVFQQDCRGKSRTKGHEKYCDLYYQTTGCDGGQKLLRSCPNGLLYTGGNGRHGLINVCDYPHRVDCGGREKHNPPISTKHCDWLYGIFGHETSCTRYWTCWNGTATEQFCVGGLLYNEETHACDWPQNVGGCQKHPLCKDDANGNVPLGKSCNRYWACQGGYPRLQRCPAMLVFDRIRKRCVAPPTEDCEVPPVTSAPEEEKKNGGGGGQGGQGGGDRRGGGGGGDPEGRRRGDERNGNRGPPPGLPFQLPEGATLLQRPPNN